MSYPFAAGKIRVLEKRLLDPNDLERMVDAPDKESAFKVLADTDIADNLGNFGLEKYEKALDEDLRETRELLEKITPDKNLLRLMYLKYDFHNIKLLFELKYTKVEEGLMDNLSFLGAEKLEELKKLIIEGRQKVNVSPLLLEAINMLNKKIGSSRISGSSGEEKDPSFIDYVCDLAYYEILKKLAQKIANPFITNFIIWKIDIINLRVFLRIMAQSKNKEHLKESLIPGGRIPTTELLALYSQLVSNSKANEVLVRFLKNYFPPSQERHLEDYIKHQDLWRLERGLDNLEMNYIRKTKYITFGPELIVAYHYAKENAVKNIRLIMTGKLNNIASEEIKERVRMIF